MYSGLLTRGPSGQTLYLALAAAALVAVGCAFFMREKS